MGKYQTRRGSSWDVRRDIVKRGAPTLRNSRPGQEGPAFSLAVFTPRTLSLYSCPHLSSFVCGAQVMLKGP
ncbi:hypothetical protein GN956_G5847 [Arapaima gigas]